MWEKFRGSALKILFKIVSVVVVIFWIVFLVCGLWQCAARRYLYPLGYKEEVFQYADAYGLPRAFVFAVIKTESGFDADAVSRAGAIGLMQIREDTGRYIAEKTGVENFDLKDPDTNINFGCFYIKYLRTRFEDASAALAAYNAGEGNVSLWLMNKEYSDDGKTLKYIPFEETREYVDKIYESFGKYKKLYGKLLDKTEKFE